MEKSSILNLANGAILERVDVELNRVMANISDPNTSPKKARSLTLQIKFAPAEDRQTISTTYSVKSTLEPMRALETSIFLTNDTDGTPIAVELAKQFAGPGQMAMDGSEVPQSKVIYFKKEA